jgi:hypothetical protein
MVDFGATTVTGDSLTNSPYHSANSSFTDSMWNQITAADEFAAGGLKYSDGSNASGVSINMGSTDVYNGTIDLDGTVRSVAPKTDYSTGIYAGTSVALDAVYGIVGTTGTKFCGFQIGGLAAGEYQIYLTGRNTATTGGYTETFYLSTSSTGGNFVNNSGTTQALTYPGGGDWSQWYEEGSASENYVVYNITLAAGEYINIGTTASNSQAAGLNSVQIVSVPEPAALGLVLGGATLIIAVRRFRHV